MFVKICGITVLKDALVAVDAGAYMLGYNFYPLSKRYIQPEACAEIQNELAQRNVSVIAVGVFVNAFREEIEQTVVRCNIDYAQFSGDETPEFAAGLDVPWFKAIRPKSTLEAVRDGNLFGRAAPPGLLVDSYRPGQYGGTGEAGDWGVASVLSGQLSILLAGGLTPENVISAIEQVRPWGVDVASGVESAPGVKDHEKIRLFLRHAKEVR
ncbi:MAG TPA: phosphoribosylanthranilate isomerase [Anaerolineales bacterium]|nr:phosphoribosylanthranilate isomerase [Anaerolineales bacterium]